MEENNGEVIVHIENPKESVQKVESKKSRTIKWILNQVRYKINTWKLICLSCKTIFFKKYKIKLKSHIHWYGHHLILSNMFNINT